MLRLGDINEEGSGEPNAANPFAAQKTDTLDNLIVPGTPPRNG